MQLDCGWKWQPIIACRCSVQPVSQMGPNFSALLNRNWATRILHLKYILLGATLFLMSSTSTARSALFFILLREYFEFCGLFLFLCGKTSLVFRFIATNRRLQWPVCPGLWSILEQGGCSTWRFILWFSLLTTDSLLGVKERHFCYCRQSKSCFNFCFRCWTKLIVSEKNRNLEISKSFDY